MKIIIIICLIVLIIIPYTRLIIFNPFKSLYYAIVDTIKYFRYKLYNKAKSGSMVAYCGHFGKGKTLSMVNDIVNNYKKYNNKKWFDGKEWKQNKVVILSNVVLNIPYIHLNNAKQITSYFEELKKVNDKFHYIVYVCIDEASVVFNSRNFKDNINPLLLNSILTCRHYNASIFYTSQKFKLVDALLRSVTQEVCLCNKIWRLARYKVYEADTVENCVDLSTLKPKKTKTYFCSNSVYSQYDTFATVDNLQKNYSVNDLLSSSDILSSLQGDCSISINVKPKKKRLFSR